MSSAPLLQPLRVSSLVKVGRWSFLAMGIIYGLSTQTILTGKENKLKEFEEKERPEKEAKKAAAKAKLNREELLYLAKETGTPIPPGF